jgi:hypothetical protein
MSRSVAEHHGKAAYHHESATRHHRAAELAYGSGDHKRAALEARQAQAHGLRASHHADLAAMRLLEIESALPRVDSAGLPI